MTIKKESLVICPEDMRWIMVSPVYAMRIHELFSEMGKLEFSEVADLLRDYEIPFLILWVEGKRVKVVDMNG